MFCISISLFAQENTELSADLMQQDTISQHRRILLERFRTGNLDSVRLVLAEFDRRPEMPVLWPSERLLVYFWTENYPAIDDLVRNFDRVVEASIRRHPPDQIVWNVLSYQAIQDENELISWIDQSGCSNEEFDFLSDLLKMMLHGDWDDQTLADRDIALFLEQYFFEENENEVPEKNNVKTISAEPYVPYVDPWRFGFGIGVGPAFPFGRLSDYLSAKTCLFFDFDVYYRRWRFSIFLQAVTGKLKKDIPLKDGIDVWSAGQSANIGNVGLTAGYSVVDVRFFGLTPFMGWSINGCTPSEQAMEDNEALRDAGIKRGVSGTLGLDAECKLHDLFPSLKRRDMMVTFDVKLMYTPAMFNNVASRYSGDMLFLVFGFNFNIFH